MLSLIFIVCIEKELNQHLMTPNYNATHFSIFHHTRILASEGLGGQYQEAVEQGMAQWWERSPPTNVARVQIPVSTPYVG